MKKTVIHCQTHQKLTSIKRTLKKRTADFVKWQHNPTKPQITKQPRANTNTRTKSKSRTFKGDYERVKKTTLPSMLNIE